MTIGAAPQTLVEHFFRHEYGRLTAVLVRRFGARRLDAIEDAIQHALERALGTWSRRGVPEEPAAWLTHVAKNFLLDQARREKTAEAHAQDEIEVPTTVIDGSSDDTLVLLFRCADERLAPRARLILCLKLLCGFSTEEIAARLFMSPESVQKTLERGRQRLKECWSRPGPIGSKEDIDVERLATVQLVLYLQFNEGYSFGPENDGLCAELCEEAIRLSRILAEHPVGNVPTTWALLALMHFHASRLRARLDKAGRLVPLSEQDRSLWDREHIRSGFSCLQMATRTDTFSRFHGEAAIQVEHALAPSFEATRWHEIAELYDVLERMHPSPVYALNRAIALAEAGELDRGLSLLQSDAFPVWFADNHLYRGALGELLKRSMRFEEASSELRAAIDRAPSRAEKLFLERKLRECENRRSQSPLPGDAEIAR